ncbi:hypothetical protein PCASD_14509 [Puccinia coronata f. sp. avenae]|uniref:Uncharacterized protein n=1 Tax=Puccinia coronata f. sp. avenae TaxID=200324 RepID=A0A2N5TF68_9BASI|nr:hypothetical protein PCASD_14509 [Puccinia coronata f. sp. avenae]
MKAYDAYPRDIKIRVVMTEPPEANNVARLDFRELHYCGITAGDWESYHTSLNLITSKSSATVIDIEQAAARTPPSPDVFATPPHQTGHLYVLRHNNNGHLSYPEASQPKSPTEIEHIDLKAFLKVAYIPANNELTQAHMIINHIDHWSYFKTATEGKLTRKGFPIGTARLLCDVAAHIKPYQKEATMALLPQLP